MMPKPVSNGYRPGGRTPIFQTVNRKRKQVHRPNELLDFSIRWPNNNR